MITADQIICHLIGDYILQSDWMANEKTKKSFAALCHVLTYGLPFLFLRPSISAFLFIVGTHFIIDRWRLARYVVALKEWLFGKPLFGMSLTSYWHLCNQATGYSEDKPAWLAVWLLIIADNILHILLNGIALTWL